MTTAKQIFDDIAIRLPHNYTTEDLMRWTNETIKKIYKDVSMQEQYTFTTIPGNNMYSLPLDCTMDTIDGVVMRARNQNGIFDNPRALKSYLPEDKMREAGYFDGREGSIGLYPRPQEVYEITIYYQKKPQSITEVTDFIDIDDNFVDLVKFNLMSIIAMSGHNPDIQLANEYILLYNNLVAKANESKNELQQKYPRIRDLSRRIRRR